MSSKRPTGSSSFSSRTLLVLLFAAALAALVVCWRLGFSAHSGQAAALVTAALAVCFLVAQFVRQRFKLSMRTLLVAMTILGVLFGLIGTQVMETRRQQADVARIERLGGVVRYDFQPTDDGNGWFNSPLGIPLPTWVRTVLGDDMFRDVVAISLWNSQATDNDLANLSQKFPRLMSVDIDDSAVTDQGLAHLRGLQRLDQLRLNGAQATSEGFRQLGDTSRIETLQLIGPEVSGATLQAVSACSNLQAVFLTDTSCGDADLAYLEQLPQLHFLSITGPSFTDDGLAHLQEVPGLQSLVLLSLPTITDAGLAHLREMNGLRHLYLPGHLSDEAVGELQAALPQCSIVK